MPIRNPTGVEIILDNISGSLVDTSTVQWTYDDPNDKIYANVIPSGLYSSLDTRYLQTTNNLSDLTSTATARTNLGLGALAVLNDLLTFDTDDLTEGTNLYYTDVRVETYCDTRYLKLTGGAITPLANSTTTFQVNQADGTNVLTVDTTNGRVGIGTATPGDMLSVVGGNISITNPAGGQIKLISTNWDDFSIRNNNGLFQIEEVGVAPRISIDSSGNVGLAGSNSTNTPTLWARQDGNVGIGETSPGAKLQINTGVAATIGLIVKAAASQSANILEIQSSAAAVLAKITPTGGALFSDKVQFTQTDGNEYIDSLNDGYMDYGATTGHRFNNDLVLPKTSGKGIKVDTTTPTFGWRDLLGEIRTRGVGATDPNDATYIGNVKSYQFAVNDECWINFHIPHDYVPGTDIYLHFHWSHNSAIVTGGAATWGADVTYAKGHDQAPFIATVNPTIAGNASTTQYQHIISEVQLSAASPSATQIDSDNLEPDGIIMIRAYLSANAITSSGAVPDPSLHFVDIHYQSTSMATKAKVPDFWT